MIPLLKTTNSNTNPRTVHQGPDKSLMRMLHELEIRKLIIFFFRVGCASCSDGKKAQTLRTVHFGRTCAPSEGSWSYRRLTETRCTRKSRDNSTVTGSTVCFKSQTRWYKQLNLSVNKHQV